jgi:hypothetical protein
VSVEGGFGLAVGGVDAIAAWRFSEGPRSGNVDCPVKVVSNWGSQQESWFAENGDFQTSSGLEPSNGSDC